MGMLAVRGENLQMKNLDVEKALSPSREECLISSIWMSSRGES